MFCIHVCFCLQVSTDMFVLVCLLEVIPAPPGGEGHWKKVPVGRGGPVALSWVPWLPLLQVLKLLLLVQQCWMSMSAAASLFPLTSNDFWLASYDFWLTSYDLLLTSNNIWLTSNDFWWLTSNDFCLTSNVFWLTSNDSGGLIMISCGLLMFSGWNLII